MSAGSGTSAYPQHGFEPPWQLPPGVQVNIGWPDVEIIVTDGDYGARSVMSRQTAEHHGAREIDRLRQLVQDKVNDTRRLYGDFFGALGPSLARGLDACYRSEL